MQTLYTAALDSLSMDDTISFMCCAINVQPEYEVDGELLVGAKYLYFIATRIGEDNVSYSLGESVKPYTFSAYAKVDFASYR